MVYGVDSASNVTSIVNTLKNNAYSFVIRYYSLPDNNVKRTSAAELAAIGNAGLKKVVVYQNLHNAYEKFSESIAQYDASDAISQAKAYGQPTGSAIYFSVDYDASASEVDGNIKSHFQKLKSILPLAGYTLGVYGSSLTCKKLKEAGIVDYTWLSMSLSHGFGVAWSDWNIKQLNGIVIDGIKCDTDEANSLTSMGAW